MQASPTHFNNSCHDIHPSVKLQLLAAQSTEIHLLTGNNKVCQCVFWVFVIDCHVGHLSLSEPALRPKVVDTPNVMSEHELMKGKVLSYATLSRHCSLEFNRKGQNELIKHK